MLLKGVFLALICTILSEDCLGRQSVLKFPNSNTFEFGREGGRGEINPRNKKMKFEKVLTAIFHIFCFVEALDDCPYPLLVLRLLTIIGLTNIVNSHVVVFQILDMFCAKAKGSTH